MRKLNQKKKSKFFKFVNKKLNNKVNLSIFLGWNNLKIARVVAKKNNIIDEKFLISKKIFSPLQEVIIVVTKGKVVVKNVSKNFLLSKFDALNFLIKKNKSFRLKILQNSEFFIISSKNKKRETLTTSKFNFKTDIKSRNLWGGQCISRPYEGKSITLVLFDLKKGFKFNDKGHKNEQITWLINGEMKFYAQNKTKTLKKGFGIDIGPKHPHGGVSNGAIGFDAFYPKREEQKYKRLNS